MNAREIILSVLTRKDLFYLKGRYTKMNKTARKNGIAVDEKEDFIYTVMALSNFCSSSSGLIIAISMMFMGGAFFGEEVLKALTISGITCIFLISIFLYVSKKKFSFTYKLCLKMVFMRYKFIFYRVQVPDSLPQIWILYMLR